MSSKITGEMLIGRKAIFGSRGGVRAFDVGQNRQIEPAFGFGGLANVTEACELAASCVDAFQATPPQTRACLLERIADKLVEVGDTLLNRVVSETGINHKCAQDRLALKEEQLRIFASLTRRMGVGAREDTLDASRRYRNNNFRVRNTPIGPVAVGASNHIPLAYATAGVNTTSALAAGCPVVALSHGSQLGTSELIGRAIQQAVADCGLPDGVFSQLVDHGSQVFDALVANHSIKGVTFIGPASECETVARRIALRELPVRFFPDVSSANPTFFLPRALNARAEHFAYDFVEQLTFGVGQRHAKSSLVVAIVGEGFSELRESLVEAIEQKPSELMFSPDMYRRYRSWVGAKSLALNIRLIAEGKESAAHWTGRAALFEVDAKTLLNQADHATHISGPAGILVSCNDFGEMLAIAGGMPHQSLVSLHFEHEDAGAAKWLLRILRMKTGRIRAVPSSRTQVDANAPSIKLPLHRRHEVTFDFEGAESIRRFLRPVTYLGMPAKLFDDSALLSDT
jgi:NADP-dependent aldehyde dehydrogenase